MVESSSWESLPDVKIDTGTANLLATGCRDAARVIRSQVTSRRALTNDAMQDFEGRFSRLFRDDQQTSNADGTAIAQQLDLVAEATEYIEKVFLPKDRVEDARAALQRLREGLAPEACAVLSAVAVVQDSSNGDVTSGI